MNFRYLKIEPPTRRSGETIYIPLKRLYLTDLALAQVLFSGRYFDSNDLFEERIAEAEDPGTAEGREKELNLINEEVAADICELLNVIVAATHVEVSPESNFQLVEDIEEEDTDE